MSEKVLGCPFCKGKNIKYYLGFRYCKDCEREYDYSDFERADSNNVLRIAFLEEDLEQAKKQAGEKK